VSTNRGCYVVRQPVHLRGTGFAPDRSYDVAIDGVDFGQAATDPSGGFATQLLPGGLAAGVAQSVDRVDVTDGTVSASTRFTLTRPAGARFLATSGNPNTLRAPFEVWGFSLGGRRARVFLHYVDPSGNVRLTVPLGRTGGQCGYLLTRPRRVFPFTPSRGRWTFQIDTRRAYSPAPGGPVWRIPVLLS